MTLSLIQKYKYTLCDTPGTGRGLVLLCLAVHLPHFSASSYVPDDQEVDEFLS